MRDLGGLRNAKRLMIVAGMGLLVARGWAAGPVKLQVDNLTNPLGIDDAAPSFSWQIEDGARGAKQTAYEVQVASSAAGLKQGKADVWDSGRIEGGQSLNVHYAGKPLTASTRYFWRVKAWDAAGKAYPESAAGWWETALLSQDAWRAGWIGFETPEEAAVRHAAAEWITNPEAKALASEKSAEQRYAYRTDVTLEKPVRRATLYATGQDTVSAWVNGEQVLTEDPLPPYKQMPWKKFVRVDVTGKLTAVRTQWRLKHCITSRIRMAWRRRTRRR